MASLPLPAGLIFASPVAAGQSAQAFRQQNGLLPHAGAQDWLDARRAFHGRKVQPYFGVTRRQLERALEQGRT